MIIVISSRITNPSFRLSNMVLCKFVTMLRLTRFLKICRGNVRMNKVRLINICYKNHQQSVASLKKTIHFGKAISLEWTKLNWQIRMTTNLIKIVTEEAKQTYLVHRVDQQLLAALGFCPRVTVLWKEGRWKLKLTDKKQWTKN